MPKISKDVVAIVMDAMNEPTFLNDTVSLMIKDGNTNLINYVNEFAKLSKDPNKIAEVAVTVYRLLREAIEYESLINGDKK